MSKITKHVLETVRELHENGVISDEALAEFEALGPEKRIVWVSLYENGNAVWHETEAKANQLKDIKLGGRAIPVEVGY